MIRLFVRIPSISDHCSRHLSHVVLVLFRARHSVQEEPDLDMFNV